jgi:uncharacterized protein YjbI with pentapeptide repeats
MRRAFGKLYFSEPLNRIDLSFANLSFASLSGADLSKANQSEAHLFQADLGGAHLREANLSGAHLSGAIATPEQFAGAEGVTPEQLAQIKSSKPAVYK